MFGLNPVMSITRPKALLHNILNIMSFLLQRTWPSDFTQHKIAWQNFLQSYTVHTFIVALCFLVLFSVRIQYRVGFLTWKSELLRKALSPNGTHKQIRSEGKSISALGFPLVAVTLNNIN